MPINKLIKKYQNNLEDFKKISRSSSKKDNNKSCVNSKEVAINGDNFKDNCPFNKHKKNKSVDAISYNNIQKLMFIEFKIKYEKLLNNKLKKILNDKFAGTWECFQHQIDDIYEYPFNEIKKIFVCKIRDKPAETLKWRNFVKDIKKTAGIIGVSSLFFEKNVQNYKFDISNLNQSVSS